MSDKPYDLGGRLVNLAADAALFCRDVPNDFADGYYGNQLLRSSGSSALNSGEMQGASPIGILKTRLRFFTKIKESSINLKILPKIEYGDGSKQSDLLGEVERLIKNSYHNN